MSGRRVAPGVAGVAAAALLALHLPLVVLAAFSVNRSRYGVQWTGVTLEWYGRMLERPDVLRALGRSLQVGIAATILATAVGTLLALGLRRLSPRARRAWDALLYLPVVTPEVVAGVSLLVLLTAAGLRLGLGTVILAHAGFAVPFVTLVVLARLDGMDRSLEEAALLLGADEWTTFRRVTLPALAPGIAAGALLAFTLSFDDFVITFFVTGPGTTTLPLLVYSMVRRGVDPTVNAISTVMLVATTALFVLAERLAGPGPRGRA